MCGRYTLRTPAARLAEQFQFGNELDWQPRYNIAPTQKVVAVRKAEEAGREAVLLHWGLVASWADDPKIGQRSINARSETVDTKPMFRSSFRRRRCLVLADGYYEWKAAGRIKQPYFIHARDDRPFAIAGLWDRWQRGELTLESCTLITTDANVDLTAVHDRMPAVLDPVDYANWLDPGVGDAAPLKALLVPASTGQFEYYPVCTEVNRPSFDRAECVSPIAVQRSLSGFESD